MLVPVGISRLHMVEMPDLKVTWPERIQRLFYANIINLQMGPIYWDPVHDVSSVVRGTWFYKDSMSPGTYFWVLFSAFEFVPAP